MEKENLKIQASKSLSQELNGQTHFLLALWYKLSILNRVDTSSDPGTLMCSNSQNHHEQACKCFIFSMISQAFPTPFK